MPSKHLGVAPAGLNRLAFAVIGVPNAGKTSTKNMFAESASPTSNIPFHTTDANPCGGSYLDPRCLALGTKMGGATRAVPTKMNIIDTAGVVGGMCDDVGLASNMYPMLQQADVLFEVCRAFEEDTVVHTEGTVEPVRDIVVVQNELVGFDLKYVQEQMAKKAKFKDEYTQQVFEKVEKCLEAGTPIRHAVWTGREEEVISHHKFATCKPIVYLINLTEADFVRQKNKFLAKTFRWVQEHDTGAPIIPYCATFEEAFYALKDDEARKIYKQEVGACKSMREKMLDAWYESTGVIRFYTKLNSVAMVWSVPGGTRAPQAGGTVHSDIENAFTGVEVTSFDEYQSEQNEVALKNAGKVHTKGKDYVIVDGDVLHFKSHGSPKSKPFSGSPKNSPTHKPSSNPGTPTHRPSGVSTASGSPHSKPSSKEGTPLLGSTNNKLVPPSFRLDD